MSGWKGAAVGAWVATLLAVGSAQAGAAFGLDRFDGEVARSDGSAETQAGAHPYSASADIDFRTVVESEMGTLIPDGSARDIRVDLPAGLVGNPTAAPTCTEAQFMVWKPGQEPCPDTAQVGVAEVVVGGVFRSTGLAPVMNIVPPDGVPAQFGFIAGGVPIRLNAEVRTEGDYGISLRVANLSQALPILRTRITFWGVPADPSHDGERGVCAGTDDLCPSQAPLLPLLTNPTSCIGPVETRLSMRSWRDEYVSASFFSHLPSPNESTLVGAAGCERVPFDARLVAAPESKRAASPTGLAVDLSIPQDENPDALGQGHLRKAVVTLPEGMSVSPSSALGLGACSEQQADLGTRNYPACPQSSKIGSVTIDTPLLERPMNGAVYLRQPRPGNLFRLLIAARGPGVVIKLPGDVRPDPVTGRLTTTFDNNPQLPFSNLHLEFKSGPRAPLSNPPACGTYTTTAELTSWSGKTVTSTSDFTLTRDGNGAPCPPRGFNPSFMAGLMNPAAGVSSDFTLTFARSDEDQTLRDLTVAMPEGLTGKIASASLCPEAAAASGTCGAASQIGTTTTGAGAGTNPFYLPGRVYITGPYKGAPFGMSIVVPAIAGPFDLGTVVVRAAIFVDRNNASLRVVSDPLPSILEGVPLLIRHVNVRIDKPGFMIAPTRCNAKSIDGVISSNEGATAARSSRFQVGGCSALPFRPRMSLRVGKRGRTRRDITTPFSATLRMTPGQANNRSVRVTLPKPLNSRLRIVNQACTLEAYRADNCGARARIGQAVAVTPLLRDPLRGSAYFVRNPARRLPDIMVALKGQVEFDLTGKVSIPRDLTLSTNFDLVPDVPITMFRLDLVAGRNGPIGVVQNLCSARTRRALVARLEIRAQSGRLFEGNQRMKVAGCGRGAARARRDSSSRRSRRAARSRGRRARPRR